MIIDKVEPYWKDADRERLAEIEKEREKIVSYWESQPTDGQHFFSSYEGFIGDTEWSALQAEENEIYAEVEARYMKATRTAKAMLADVSEIVGAIEKGDFLEYLTWYRVNFIDMNVKDLELKNHYTKLSEENFENCYYFILRHIRVQLNYFADSDKYTDMCLQIVEKRASLWYVKRDKNFIPYMHNTATDALIFMDDKDSSYNKLSERRIYNKIVESAKRQTSVELVVADKIVVDDKVIKCMSVWSVGVSKLFLYALSIATEEKSRKIVIDLKRYATLTNKRYKELCEDPKADKKLIKSHLDKVRAKVNKNILTLLASQIRWEIKDKTGSNKKKDLRDFYLRNICSGGGIVNRKICLEFHEDFYNAVTHSTDGTLYSQFPISALSISESQENAFKMFIKMSINYNNDNNIKTGQYNILGVSTLLGVTSLPTKAHIEKTDRGHEYDRIFIPFVEALNNLRDEGKLTEWNFARSGNDILTDEEHEELQTHFDYYAWEKLYVVYAIKGAPDHTERIAKNEADKETKKKKQKKSGSKKKA